MAKRRVDKAEFEHRVAMTMDLLIQGYPYSAIVKVLSDKYMISPRHAKRYVKIAQQKRQEILKQYPKAALLGEIYTDANYIFKDAIKNKNHQIALKAMELRRKIVLEATSEVISHESTGTAEPNINRRIEAFLEQLGESQEQG